MKLDKNKFIIGLSTTILGSVIASSGQISHASEPTDPANTANTSPTQSEPVLNDSFTPVEGIDIGEKSTSEATPSLEEQTNEADTNSASTDETIEISDQVAPVGEANNEEKAEAPEADASISDGEKEERTTEASEEAPAEETNEVNEETEEVSAKSETSTESTDEKSKEDAKEIPETQSSLDEADPEDQADESVEANEEDTETTDTASTEAELAADSVDEASTEKAPVAEENTEATNKETADVANTEQKDDEKTSADAPQETPAGEGPDATTIAKLSEEQIGKVENPLETDANVASTNDVVTEDDPLTGENDTADGSGDGKANNDLEAESIKEGEELPETAEGAQLPAAEEASGKEPNIQTLAAGDAPLTEEGAEIAPGKSVKDSEQEIANKDGYNDTGDVVVYDPVHAGSENQVDKTYFELSIKIDTSKRVIDDFYFQNQFPTSDVDLSSIRFKNVGESTNSLGPVTLMPNNDLEVQSVFRGKERNIFYTVDEDTLKKINDKKGETVISVSGNYKTPKSINDDTAFKSGVIVNHFDVPYPNENNNGDIISVNTSSVNGNDKLKTIPVAKEYTPRKISDGVYDTGISVNNVGEGDKDRITGRVYTRSGKELDDVRVFYDGNSVKLKLPEGAVKDDNSVFNGDLKDYKDLEVELFIRPRTDEEIRSSYTGDGESLSTSDTTKEITNLIANDTGTDTKEDPVTVNTYNRERYDNFNTLGRFEISLDDQSNYDVTYWQDGKDTTDKVNRLTAGKTSTIEEKYNAYNSVLKSDLDAALSDEIAERSLDTSKLKEIGENSYVTEDGWQIEVDEEAKTFKITPPLSAERGDEISLPVNFKFSNGSEKDFPLIFRVDKEVIDTPKYEIKKDEPNTKITSTPSYDGDEDTVAPDRIELNSKYNEDDHGNLWNVSIDEKTGEITATTPYEVNGEYTLRVPITAYYKDPVEKDENGEPIEHIRRTYAEFKTQATKPYERTYTETEPIVYEVQVIKDPELAAGTEELVQQGKNGTKEVTYKQLYNDDGSRNGEPTVENEEITTEAKKHIIKVGTKTENTKVITENIPYDYRVEYDENLEAEKYEIEPGKDGTKTTTWNIVNSEVVGEPKVEKTDPVQGVIRVGSKDFTGDVNHKEKEEIPYKVITKENPELTVGTTKVTTPGEAGTKEVTYTVPVRNGALDSQDGKQITSTEEVIKEAVDEVVEIGTKSIEERVEIPFNTEYKYDDTLKAGEIVEETPGQNGTNKVVTSYDPATKSAKMTEEVVTEPTNRVVRVGGMTNGTETVTEKVPFTVEIRENTELEKGEYKVIQDGVVGEKEKILTIENSKVTDTSEGKTITEAKNQIIEVGSADFTGEVTHEVTEEIPFTVRIVEDPNMAPGTSRVETKGEAGSKTTRYTQNIVNGAADGELKSEEIVTDTTKAPVEEVIHVGTAPVNSENTATSGDIPVEITYTYDSTKDRGTAEKGTFTPGKVETKIVNQYNPETGKIETTTEETVTNAKQEIIVGTKDYTGTFTHEETKVTPFETIIEHDPNLKAGETVTDQVGVNGVETRTITQKFTNGEIAEKSYSDWNTESIVQNEIIRVGSLTEGTKKHEEAIPFDYKVEYDPNIPAGEYKITQEGKDGKRTTEWTIKNSEVVGDPTVTEEAPVDAIIKVGNKDFSGLATHTEDFTIPYKVEIRENPNLPVGTRNTIQEGVDGSYKITYKQDIKNGETVGELTTVSYTHLTLPTKA